MNLEGIQIDAPVLPLVDALNRLPDIYTISSCGGHSGELAISQVPEGEFYVNFHVDMSAAGWRSLAIVAWTRGTFYGEIDLTCWYSGDERDDPGEANALVFELAGEGSPADAAAVLDQVTVRDRE